MEETLQVYTFRIFRVTTNIVIEFIFLIKLIWLIILGDIKHIFFNVETMDGI